MAGLVGAAAVAVVLIGGLTSKKKKQKKQPQKHQQRYLPVSLSLPLPLPLLGALSAGAALYFGWKRCRPQLQKSTTTNNSHCNKVQEEEEEEEEEEECSSTSLKDRSATDELTLEDKKYYCKESQSQSLASGDYSQEPLKLRKGKDSVFPWSTTPQSSSSANNSNIDDEEEEVTQGNNNVNVRVLRPGKPLASGVYSPELFKLRKGKGSVSPSSTNPQSSSPSANNSSIDDQEEEEKVVQGDNNVNVRVLRPGKPRLDPEAMQRRSRVLAEVDSVDLFGEFSLSPSSSSLFCSSGSPPNIVFSRDCNEGSSVTSGDGRVHAYEAYLSDPSLSPATRAQVLRAKSIVERLYRPDDQQVS